MATDCNGRYTLLDPYAGAQLALAEAYRNVVTTGAVPLAVTDCLNFGSPEDPAVMWQFEQAVHGLADGCAAARDPRHRRQCQPLQPDRLGRPSCPPRWSACSASSTTCAGAPSPASARTPARRCCCWATPATSSTAREWATWCTATSAACRPRSTWSAERLLGDDPGRRVAGRDDLGRARPVRGRPRPGAGRDVPGRRDRCPDRAARGRRPVRLAVLRVDRAGGGRRAAHRRAAVHRDVHGPRGSPG